jgi:alginate O-acetyltransferase complex protein AlgI
MLFNSISFYLFFIGVFFFYFLVFKNNVRGQNWLLLLASYLFYGLINWKMIPLVLIDTAIIFYLGIAIKNTNSRTMANFYTTISIICALGLLLYFKYFNFFIGSFSSLFEALGISTNTSAMNVILPIGISFFTFKLISYIIEINRGKIEPTKDHVIFFTYISFFPTIVSGPIDRPNAFIPQLKKLRVFNYSLAVDGCKQILWGMFQKLVIADNLSITIHSVWGDIPSKSGTILIITAILFSIQLYNDFSGYSHVAIGIGKILGFQISRNFNTPFFSTNVAVFWRNWNISLTSWLADYVFMPLNIKLRDLGSLGLIIAILINLFLIGMWHGANSTFIVFGLYNGLLFIPVILSGSFYTKNKTIGNKLGLPHLFGFFKMAFTFLLITIGLVLFKAENMGQAFQYYKGVFNLRPIVFKDFIGVGFGKSIVPIFFALLFFVLEWKYINADYPLEKLGINWKRAYRWLFYALFTFTLIMYMSTQEEPFIYLKF